MNIGSQSLENNSKWNSILKWLVFTQAASNLIQNLHKKLTFNDDNQLFYRSIKQWTFELGTWGIILMHIGATVFAVSLMQ